MKSFTPLIIFACITIIAKTEAFNALRSKRQITNPGGNSQPQCLGGPLTPLNGQLSYSTGSIIGPWPAGAIATLFCNAGYVLNGAATSVCQNGIFNPVGICVPVNNGGIGGVPIGGNPVNGGIAK
uniref:Sushi domain-containing protein n=1 Tax=Panagrolaimus davidi TaxID=227884 RepID=A0A914PXT0_9BILA